MYHVMARGDRRENIVDDDQDRETFVRTLGEACEKSGFRILAYVLMSNHYHLLLETPKANLSRGMGWERVLDAVVWPLNRDVNWKKILDCESIWK